MTTKMVIRAAPQWAWEIIDETLALDCESKAFDSDLREMIRKAFYAMEDWPPQES